MAINAIMWIDNKGSVDILPIMVLKTAKDILSRIKMGYEIEVIR